MKNILLPIISLSLLFSVLGCGDSDILNECDQKILEFFDASPSDGTDVGCDLYIIKEVRSINTIYFLGSKCSILEVIPRDCKNEFILKPVTEEAYGVVLDTEIIGVIN